MTKNKGGEGHNTVLISFNLLFLVVLYQLLI